MIEWGYQFRHASGAIQGRLRECAASDRDEAAAAVQAFLADSPGRWYDAGLLWRTAAVPAGPWQRYRALGARQLDKSSPQVVSDILSQACETVIPPEVTALWTADERDRAVAWAGAEYLSASDHEDVQRVPKPAFVERAEEICASPAQAQLAVEAWTARDSRADFMKGGAAVAGQARDALSGLVVLTRQEQPS